MSLELPYQIPPDQLVPDPTRTVSSSRTSEQPSCTQQAPSPRNSSSAHAHAPGVGRSASSHPNLHHSLHRHCSTAAPAGPPPKQTHLLRASHFQYNHTKRFRIVLCKQNIPGDSALAPKTLSKHSRDFADNTRAAMAPSTATQPTRRQRLSP